MSKCLKYELKENKTVFITIVLLLSLLCLFLKLCKKKKAGPTGTCNHLPEYQFS